MKTLGQGRSESVIGGMDEHIGVQALANPLRNRGCQLLQPGIGLLRRVAPDEPHKGALSGGTPAYG